MNHPTRCHCEACLKLDRRWPADGHQLKLIDQTPVQYAPTEAEAADQLFALAGHSFIPSRQGRLIL